MTVGGVTYNGTGGTRTWVYNDNNCNNCIRMNFPGLFSYHSCLLLHHRDDDA